VPGDESLGLGVEKGGVRGHEGPPMWSGWVDVDFDGTIGWNGVAVTNDELQAKLREVAAEADQQEVHLRPNKLVTYKNVAFVMASAQRLGVVKIGLVGNEQFMN
jgi:biopolymer transport protein ExbD